jgi:hypothetical protein
MYAWQVRHHRESADKGIILPPTTVMRVLSVLPAWDVIIEGWQAIDIRKFLEARSDRMTAINPSLRMIGPDKSWADLL